MNLNRRKALQQLGLVMGGVATTSTWLGLLESCQSTPRLEWVPEFFNQEEALFIARMVDIILPRTDTPGALDVKVDMFLDKVVANIYDDGGKRQMRNDISAFNEECQTRFGDNFIDLNEENQIECLRTAEKNAGKLPPRVWGTAVGRQEPVGFYRSLKSMLLWAYFSSEEIGKNVLNYDPVPQNYHGCIPLSEVGNKWSL